MAPSGLLQTAIACLHLTLLQGASSFLAPSLPSIATSFAGQRRVRTLTGADCDGGVGCLQLPQQQQQQRRRRQTQERQQRRGSSVVRFSDGSTSATETEAQNYVQCGKCKSVYVVDLQELGNGKKVTCSVCGHAWWQTTERAQKLRDGWQFADMSEERLSTIKENIAAGRAPNDEKPKVKGAVTVFIGNLPFTYGDAEIEKIFSPFGAVASVTLVKQADGRSKGYAFVDMVEKEAGEKAIADLNGSDIDGRNLNVALGGDSK